MIPVQNSLTEALLFAGLSDVCTFNCFACEREGLLGGDGPPFDLLFLADMAMIAAEYRRQDQIVLQT